MSSRYPLWTNCIAAAAMVFAACSATRACEDEHPPVADEPKQKFSIHDHAGREVLSMAVDPRGLGSIVPAGEATNTWINSDEATGVWHYREWQWWDGHPWGDSCRPRFYADVELRRAGKKQQAAIIEYRIDGFTCRQTFMLPDTSPPNRAHFDLVTTVRNDTESDVLQYGQYFACYTRPNRERSFWYWDEAGDLRLFADRNVAHLDGYIAHPQAYFVAAGVVPHCPRGGGKIVGRWHKPVMVSQPSPAGWRSVIMIESRSAAALAQGMMGEAMDYILFPGPGRRSFEAGDEFSAHIRHVMIYSPAVPSAEMLEELWAPFEQTHAEFNQRAKRLAEKH